jgi:hypothetical protein
MKTAFLAATFAATVAAVPAQASVLTQWNFNASNLTPSLGVGTASSLGTTSSFSSGVGSSDPAASPDQAWSSTGYPAQGTGDKTEGVQFLVSTLGMKDVVFTFDNRNSGTASRFMQVQYTIDGSSYADAVGGLFETTVDGVFVNGRTVSFTGVGGVDNNASFGVRIVTTFAPGSSGYLATGTGSYGTAGTIRYDMVSFYAAPIPEPGTYALLLAGLAAIGFVARRRQA